MGSLLFGKRGGAAAAPPEYNDVDKFTWGSIRRGTAAAAARGWREDDDEDDDYIEVHDDDVLIVYIEIGVPRCKRHCHGLNNFL